MVDKDALIAGLDRGLKIATALNAIYADLIQERIETICRLDNVSKPTAVRLVFGDRLEFLGNTIQEAVKMGVDFPAIFQMDQQ